MKRWTLLMVALGSLGWVWNSSTAPTGTYETYHICNNCFTSAQQAEIESAAVGWRAGYGRPLRGAVWNFVRGSNVSTCLVDNGVNEVCSLPGVAFALIGGFGTMAVTTPPGSTNGDVDIIFNEDWDWVNEVPSAAASGDESLGQVALHEFGHFLGLDHEDDLIATMNSGYPAGGDLGGYGYRPHEDDYSGLKANRAQASTGVNLALGRFHSGGEVWDSTSEGDWEVCQEIVPSPDGPPQIYGVVLGTGSHSATVEWWLSADQDCHSGTAYPVGDRTPTMSANTPYLIHPNPYDFRYVPEGYYYLCAMIDPDDDISETVWDDEDNDVVSEVKVLVKDCD